MAGRLVNRFMRGMEVGPTLQVLTAWARVAGPLVADHLRAVRFSDGTLFVRADQGVWAHQLTFLRPELLRKYEEVLGRQVVRDIRLTSAPPAAPGQASGLPGRSADTAARGRHGGPGGAPRFAALPAEEIAEIEARAARHIRDPELATRWARLEARIKSAQLARRLAGQKACRKCGVCHPGAGPLCPVCEIETKPPIVPGLEPPR